MTFISCLVVGIAFGIAVLLLVVAGALVGWNLPRLLAVLRGSGGERRSPDRGAR